MIEKTATLLIGKSTVVKNYPGLAVLISNMTKVVILNACRPIFTKNAFLIINHLTIS